MNRKRIEFKCPDCKTIIVLYVCGTVKKNQFFNFFCTNCLTNQFSTPLK